MSGSPAAPLLVLGATTVSGAALLEQSQGRAVLVAGRRRPQGWPGDAFVACDLEANPPAALPPLPAGCVLVSFAPIWQLAPFLARWLAAPGPAPIAAVVACSSSSARTKRFAANRADQQLVERLRQAEASLMASAGEAAIPCQILRPTLIYGQAGGHSDQNLSRLIGLMGRLPLLPLPAHTGLRQPIHAGQLAAAALHLADHAADHAGAVPSPLEIGGDEVLSYTAMLQRLQATVRRLDPGHPAGRCRLLPVPNRLFHLLAAPLLPASARGFEAVLRIQANLAPFQPVHQLLGRPAAPFPVAPLALTTRSSP
jgi:hypothetical protein